MSANGGTTTMRWTTTGALALGLLLSGWAVTGPVAAQDVAAGTDPGWLPWLGCWEVVDGQATGPDGAPPPLLCVRPAAGGPGVELVPVSEGRVSAAEPLRADGRRRDLARDGCEGWERGAFSEDGHRVYLRSEHVCPGGVERVATGVLAWVSPYEWMEVRTVEVRGTPQTWVRRYRVASSEDVEAAGVGYLAGEPSMAVESGRMAAAAALRVDDVVEASGHLHPDAAGAWLAEQGDPLDLDAEALVRMDDAGVPGSVIDVAVAVSYPDRFVVDRSGSVEEQAPAADRGRAYRRGRRPARGYGIGGWYARPYPYRPYRLYGSYFSPWGYSPWGYTGYGYGFGYRPSVVYVSPRTDAGGRVVNGRGYTRGSGSSRPAARPESGRSPAPAPSAGRGGGSGSGGAVSPSGGYRGGGSSGSDGGRKARPRGGSGHEEGGSGGTGGR